MTINIINPNFYLINTAKNAETARSNSAANTSGGADGSAPSFAAAFEDAVSSLQNTAASAGNSAAAGSGSTISLDEIFQKASDTYGVPVQLLKAVAKAESNFNPASESSAGAQGIMQLMPATARSLGVTDAFDPEQNIMGGAKYLSQQLARYDGNTVLALAAYNAGPGNVAKYDGVPPFKETQNYITKVMAYAGEPITAGSLTASTDQTSASNTGSVLEQLQAEMLAADPGTVDSKDYELLLNLYRYKMQLNVLTDDNTDSDSNSSSLFGNLSSLV
jgi:hypothetical protein